MSMAYAPTLTQLAHEREPTAAWWLAAARALDDLDERLAVDATNDSGPEGAFVDVVAREPWLANTAARLATERQRLVARVHRLRRVVAALAGDPVQAQRVQHEMAEVANAESRYLVQSRTLYWDSYNQDLGGE